MNLISASFGQFFYINTFSRLLCRWLDFIIRPQSEWTRKKVDSICNTYGRKHIKITDAINRRLAYMIFVRFLPYTYVIILFSIHSDLGPTLIKYQ